MVLNSTSVNLSSVRRHSLRYCKLPVAGLFWSSESLRYEKESIRASIHIVAYCTWKWESQIPWMMGRCPGSRRRTQGTSRSISAVRIPLRRGAKSWKPMRMVSSSYERAHRHIILLWLTCSEDKMDTSSPIGMRHDSLSASCCVWFCLDTWLSPCHPCLDNINFCTHLSCIPGIWRSQMPRFCSHHISRAWDQDRLSISASPWVSAVSDRLASVRKLRVKSQHEYWDEVRGREHGSLSCDSTRINLIYDDRTIQSGLALLYQYFHFSPPGSRSPHGSILGTMMAALLRWFVCLCSSRDNIPTLPSFSLVRSPIFRVMENPLWSFLVHAKVVSEYYFVRSAQ